MKEQLSAPAKINLFLQITGKRPDGYHNLVTLMCAVSLHDTISMTFGAEKTTVSCSDPDIPEDETNLAHRAASLFFKSLNIYEGVKIFIDKKIPAGAGLGGGSSDAAAVLSGLNCHYDSPFSREELMVMGLSLGADVPFFIFQKPAIATGIGEKLEICKKLKPFKVLLIFPGFSVSTAYVYKNFNLRLTRCKKKIINICFKDSIFDVGLMCNDLETVVTLKYPEIQAIKTLLLNHGAEGALMSGSGSAVFGLFSDSDRARSARETLSQYDKWKVYLADMII
ncbi:MAG: 4-(cytidine 5'-diphospho)-2-C-methyl-D-erythritol kinase [Deltaproteobacteria bacterium]|nr:MAG: 4-(cytidine 5'-diphospho)-2-C-methyl-D-erythritol kinase [Deltaproteobacteria bacterium]